MIEISSLQKEEIMRHAKESMPHEACGILAGKTGKVEKVYEMTNKSDTPGTCYFMDPKEQLKVMKEIRNSGLEILAIYHSHTGSGAYPSARDIELAYYPEAAYIIISLQNKVSPGIRTFKLVEGKIIEEEIIVS